MKRITAAALLLTILAALCVLLSSCGKNVTLQLYGDPQPTGATTTPVTAQTTVPVEVTTEIPVSTTKVNTGEEF